MLITMASFAGNAATVEHGNKATLKEKVASMTKEQKEARIAELRIRANEINAMDIKALTKAEKKELKKEIRDLNREARYLGAEDVAVVILGGALFSVLLLLLIA